MRYERQESVCQVGGCDRKPIARSYCTRHYQQWKRGVTPTVEPQKVRGTCTFAGCSEPHLARGLCTHHYHRLRDGVPMDAPTGPRTKGDEIGYAAAHARVRKAHGSASSHRCVDCGAQAQDWSYDHLDPDEKVELVRWGHGKETMASFSTKVEHYQPRCRPCHRTFDA